MGAVCGGPGWRALLRALPLLSVLQPLPGVSLRDGKFTSTSISAAPLTFAAVITEFPPSSDAGVLMGEPWGM